MPRVLRVVPLGVKRELVEEAIAWIDERWRGGVFVPTSCCRSLPWHEA